MNPKVTFYNYSNEGYVFLGGAILLSTLTRGILVAGNLKFAGTYGGSIEYNDFRIPTDNTGNIISIFAPCKVIATIDRSGSVTFKSGGNSILTNPYPLVVNVTLVTLPNGTEETVYTCDPDYSNR